MVNPCAEVILPPVTETQLRAMKSLGEIDRDARVKDFAELKMALETQKFDSFNDWVNNASRKLAYNCRDKNLRQYYETPPENERAICYDTAGRRCFIGRDFMRARDEGTFPVRYIWPDQIILLALLTPYFAPVKE